MGTTLTGTTPQDTYDSLIKVTDNGPLSGTLKTLTDGLGNDSTLSLSTSEAKVSGLLSVSAFTASDLSSSTQLNLTRTATQFTGIAIRGSVAADRALFSVGSDDALHIGRHAGGGGAWTKQVSFLDNGNVGIGTSAPVAKLESLDGDIKVTTQSEFAGFVTSRNLIPSSTGTQIGRLQYSAYRTGTTYVDSAAIQAFATEAWSASSTPTWLSLQTVASGSTSLVERVRIDSDGLKFNGDTLQVNALDDYEEGTWTMGLSFGGGTTGIVYDTNTGTYTKIGRQVTVNGLLALSNKGSSTGSAFLTGLPFTVASGLSLFSAVTFGNIRNITFADMINAYTNQGATNVTLGETTNLGAFSVLTDADFANNSEMAISITYFV